MSDWPPFVGDVARLGDVVGPQAMLALCEGWGGTRLYVPRQPAPESEICRAIGADALARLAARSGAEYVKVPRAVEWRVLVYRLRRMTYPEIVRACGCTEGTVWRILNRHAMTMTQLSLQL